MSQHAQSLERRHKMSDGAEARRPYGLPRPINHHDFGKQ